MIDGADLSDTVKQDASIVFRRLGEAEAALHNLALEKVHFHEVGAVDSICDIVASCLALSLLGIDRIYISAVNVGSRTVRTEHGTLPIPATFRVSPADPAPMLTLSMVPLTSVVAAVPPEVAPAYCALKV